MTRIQEKASGGTEISYAFGDGLFIVTVLAEVMVLENKLMTGDATDGKG